MWDETKPIRAADILEHPEGIYQLQSAYVLIVESSMLGVFGKLIEAINLFAEYGWETVSISRDQGSIMNALVKNPNFKRKGIHQNQDEGTI